MPLPSVNVVKGTDTPRTKELKDLRQKRLAYFGSISSESDKKSPRPPIHPKTTSPLSTPASQSTTSLNSISIITSPKALPTASSPRVRRAIYRPRSSSANSGSSENRNRQVNHESNGSSPRVNGCMQNISQSPRGRCDSFSSDMGSSQKVGSPSQRISARDSYESLLSDIGSEFTDITNTDLLLTDRLADQSISLLVDRHRRDTNRSSSKSRNLSSDRSEKRTSRTGEINHISRNSQNNKITLDVSNLTGGQKQRSWENSSESDFSLDLKMPPHGKSKPGTSKQTNIVGTVAKRSPKPKTDNQHLVHNESLETLASGSQNTSGHLTSDRTSVWLDSDKSTGYRTFSNDTMLDELLNDHETTVRQSKTTNNNQIDTQTSVYAVTVEGDFRDSINKEHYTQNSITDYKSFSPIKTESRESIDCTAKPAHSSEFLHSKVIEQMENSLAEKKPNGNPEKKPKAADEINFSNLSAVLGEERLRRLLQNFQESEDYSDIQSDAYTRVKKGSALDEVNIWASLDTEDGSLVNRSSRLVKPTSDESKKEEVYLSSSSTELTNQKKDVSSVNLEQSYELANSSKVRPVAHVYPERYHTSVKDSQETFVSRNGALAQSSQFMNHSSQNKPDTLNSLSLDIQGFANINNDEAESIIDELGLHTHRPSDSPRELVLPYHHSRQDKPRLSEGHHMENSGSKSITSPGTTQESGTVKYCFSVNEIYAQASSLPFTDTNCAGSPPMVSRKDVQLASNMPDSTNNSNLAVSPNARISTISMGKQTQPPVTASVDDENILKTGNMKSSVDSDLRMSNNHSKPPFGSVVRASRASIERGQRSSMDRRLAWSVESGDGDSGLIHAVNKQQKALEEKGQGDADRFHVQHKVKDDAMDQMQMEQKQYDLESSPPRFPLPDLQSIHDDRGPTHSKMPSKPMPPSIERYFQSIEQVSHVSSVCSDTFEPVPEQDIDITPRGPMIIQGTQMSASVDTSKPPVPRSSKRPQMSEGDPATHQGRGAPPARLDQVSDDELYNLVQSAITEIDTARSGAITQKLQDIGINFEFLRESYESHKSAKIAGSQPHEGDITLEQNSVSNAGNTDGKMNGNQDIRERNGNEKSVAQVCPNCEEINSAGTNKCKKCARNLNSGKTVPVKSFQSPRISTTNNAQNKRNNNRTSKDSNKSSVTITSASQQSHNNNLQAQLSLNLRSSIPSVDSSVTNSIQTNTLSQGSRARNKRRNLLRDRSWMDADSSISLDYSETFDNPRESIPHMLKAELSIDVRGSSESSLPPSVSGKGPGAKKIRKSMVEDIKVRDDSETNSVQNLEGAVGGAVVGVEVDGELRINVEDTHTVDEEVQAEEQQDVVIDASYQEFLHRLINDPRLRNGSVPQPGVSQGRPSTAGARKGQYAGVQSKVRSSWDKEQPHRRWQKSNTAWSSYNSRELSKPAGTGLMAKSLQVPRPSSAGKSRDASPCQAGQRRPRPQSADISGRRSLPHHDCGSQQADIPHFEPENSHRPSGPLLNVQAVSNREKHQEKDLKNNRLNNYKKYLALAQGYTGKLYDVEERHEVSNRSWLHNSTITEAMRMSPRVHSGEMSLMQCLPDEIMLMILSYLPHKDLAKCMVVCQHFNRVASDDSLWRTIVIRKSLNMTDHSLLSIAKKQPLSLSLLQCHGSKVTAQGLREAFRTCADTLQELNFTGCSRGHLTGDHILLHASSRCVNITSLDASWCNVNDNGVMAMAEACHRLSSLSVNGCQQLSDDAINAVVIKHGIYLHTLELFGCFNITARGIASVANHCKSLVTLNLGQCWKLTDSCISNLAPSLTSVENLDLRGCKQIKDHTVHQVVKHCPHLTTLSLANCPNLTDATMSELATYCPNIVSLDVCGCKLVSNQGVRAVTHSCQQLQYLDLSSTAITSKSVTTLASYNSQRLEVLKINFCKQITMQSLVKLARNCKMLERLFLYGVRGLGPLEEVKQYNHRLHIETDQARPV